MFKEGLKIDKAGALGRLGGDESLYHEVVDIFLQTAPQDLLRCEEAFASKDPKAIAHATHALKSAAANVGAVDLSQMALRAEATMKANSNAALTPETAKSMFEALKDVFDRTIAELSRAKAE